MNIARTEYKPIKKGDRVESFSYVKGIIISSIGIGHTIKFGKSNIVKIQNGCLKIIR